MVTFTIAMLSGFALSPFLEYAWHAWIAHGQRISHPSVASHHEHHRTPDMRTNIAAELRENAARVTLTLVLIGLPLGWFFSAALAVGGCAGLLAGYVFSTLYHAQMHRRAPRTTYEHWMWRFHFHHHFANAGKNFGLSNPVFDFLFGTAVVPEEVIVPSRLRPVWLDGPTPGFRVKDQARVA